MYKLLANPRNRSENLAVIRRLDDGAFIPMDEGNTDYQTYLKWLEEGNTPEPADEQGA
jgi:hypothetical protein